MNKFDIFVGIPLMFILVFTLGVLCTLGYQAYSNHSIYNGLHFDRNMTELEAENYANSLDGYGHFVCVNVNGMSYEKGLDVCAHEIGHEIFAEYCEKGNIDKCMNITK